MLVAGRREMGDRSPKTEVRRPNLQHLIPNNQELSHEHATLLTTIKNLQLNHFFCKVKRNTLKI